VEIVEEGYESFPHSPAWAVLTLPRDFHGPESSSDPERHSRDNVLELFLFTRSLPVPKVWTFARLTVLASDCSSRWIVLLCGVSDGRK